MHQVLRSFGSGLVWSHLNFLHLFLQVKSTRSQIQCWDGAVVPLWHGHVYLQLLWQDHESVGHGDAEGCPLFLSVAHTVPDGRLRAVLGLHWHRCYLKGQGRDRKGTVTNFTRSVLLISSKHIAMNSYIAFIIFHISALVHMICLNGDFYANRVSPVPNPSASAGWAHTGLAHADRWGTERLLF